MSATPAHIEAFFDTATATVTYVVFDAPGAHAAIIDPVLDYDPKAGRTHTGSAQRVLDFVAAQKLTVDWILETHAHADHLSAARWLKERVGGRIAIGAHIRDVQHVFKKLFHLGADVPPDGSQFDHLFEDGETFAIGALQAQAMFVPGHTPADMAYRVGDAVFVGDTLFMPDVGTARCDFPGGNAHTLFRSIRRLLSMPPSTRLFMCHDYPPAGRAPKWETTVGEQRRANIHVHDGIDEATFVAMREARDRTLDMPTLILPAVQVNIRAGDMPAPEANGTRYLKIPLNAL
ncbi:MBL fold metallo-hydrolase [Pandoraea nosoerga]|uniref:Beta-lactamase n=1 Tax=Pandoraea nosoerga TaxID=2508296 RepID=A0A5E4W6H6_9BURK|nr:MULTISPECIES: MBL fold metallo-hydrolase [Pandoraea]MBN4666308.1 MBL fold metallo-hydrolase [Pandoraea nosoerga]MBN4676012.1 MBL fold metallo-hydrolase [Pandoraea nosoerga]MBN4682107.1 MBL fold metallo-hydrolase [Pandoraea nosoerga]MBN4747205.1 MBL fold metallo-hydrolase [Pandoraea nosoerga]VVE20228.1 beta-lactamase [Pandoraea nosoerga]